MEMNVTAVSQPGPENVAGSASIIILYPDGTIRSVNEGVLNLLGWREDELIGKPITNLLDGERPSPSPIPFDIAKYESNVGVESCLLAKDNRKKSVLLTSSAVRGRDGAVDAIVCVVHKLAEQNQPESEWRNTQEWLSSIINRSTEAILIVDFEGRVRFANPMALTLFGCCAGELLGEMFGFALTIGESSEINIIRHAGSPGVGEMRVTETEWRGKPVFLVSIRDITDRKLLEEKQVRQTEELARSNRELQEFAYIASHDLQEPLRKVANFAELLARRYTGQLDSKADTFIHYIVDGATRMQKLIRDLLSYSRVGKAQWLYEPTDFGEVLDEALLNLQSLISENEAVVTAESLPTLQANRHHATQLLQNLIGNAIKYRGHETPRIHVSARQCDDEWEFAVRDNGIGIESRFSDRIFVIFQRLHTVQEYPGTGVGLAICKKIVERHGGRIWLESTPKKGSIFYFTLPLNHEEYPEM